MNKKYRILGTSFEKQIKKYIDLIKKIGSNKKIFFTEDESSVCYIFNDKNKIMRMGSLTTARQLFEVWELLGLVKMVDNEFILICESIEYTFIVDKYKWTLLKSINKNFNHKNTANLAFTKMLNILYLAKEITFTDIKLMGVKMMRGNLSIDKINKDIGDFERRASKDKYFVEILKGVINAK